MKKTRKKETLKTRPLSRRRRNGRGEEQADVGGCSKSNNGSNSKRGGRGEEGKAIPTGTLFTPF